jgi:hypothetical protein
MVEAELSCKDYDFDRSEITFKILNKDKTTTADAYNWLINQIKTNNQYLSPKLKETFIIFIEKIANAFSPATKEEGKLIVRLTKIKNHFMEILIISSR